MTGTGFKDINGVEIAEDSVVKFTFTTGKNRLVIIGHVREIEGHFSDGEDMDVHIEIIDSKEALDFFCKKTNLKG